MTRYTFWLIALFVFPFAASADLKPFVAESLVDIEQQYKSRPFLMTLWSSDCAPCRLELRILSEIKSEFPDLDLDLVLISTDNIKDAKEINRILKEYHLDAINSWIFAETNIERLRYKIDPHWSGELPRSYFYKVDATRLAVSGSLTKERITKWIELETLKDSGK